MDFMTRALILVSMVTCLTSVAHAIAGEATFSDPTTPTACFGSGDMGVMVAAANIALFDNGTRCGARYRVSCTGSTSSVLRPCTGNSVDVTIVDVCPACSANQLDLSREAFAVIANLDAGRITIDYNRI